MEEGWSDKLKDQSNEGCNVAGRIRVNKVIGNIHLSPGKSFQTSSRNIYELVPYLRDDGNRHDFSHTIHHFGFMTDAEYNMRAARSGTAMKRRLGLDKDPLDGYIARVSQRALSYWALHSLRFILDYKGPVYVPIFPEGRFH